MSSAGDKAPLHLEGVVQTMHQVVEGAHKRAGSRAAWPVRQSNRECAHHGWRFVASLRTADACRVARPSPAGRPAPPMAQTTWKSTPWSSDGGRWYVAQPEPPRHFRSPCRCAIPTDLPASGVHPVCIRHDTGDKDQRPVKTPNLCDQIGVVSRRIARLQGHLDGMVDARIGTVLRNRGHHLLQVLIKYRWLSSKLSPQWIDSGSFSNMRGLLAVWGFRIEVNRLDAVPLARLA